MGRGVGAEISCFSYRAVLPGSLLHLPGELCLFVFCKGYLFCQAMHLRGLCPLGGMYEFCFALFRVKKNFMG